MGILIIKIIGLIIIALGVIAICDARILSKKFFSNSDKNSSAKLLRVFGFLVAIIGTFIVYFAK